jgi:hypothetical protein
MVDPLVGEDSAIETIESLQKDNFVPTSESGKTQFLPDRELNIVFIKAIAHYSSLIRDTGDKQKLQD